jgi:hypothetical protein
MAGTSPAKTLTAGTSKNPDADSRIANQSLPVCAGHEKADLGQARIGAHIGSFNFASTLIRAIASSRR